MTFFRHKAPLAALLACSLMMAPAAFAQDANPVLAKVNGVELRQSDLNAAEEDLGAAATQGMSPEQKKDYLLSFASDLVIAVSEAEKRGLANNADFKAKLAYFRQKLLVETMLNEETKAKVNEAETRKVYDAEMKKLTPEEEVRARHILVENEAEAKDIAAKLKAGADFAALAKEKSKDPGSAAEGGDLGYFAKGQMVKEFADTAFAQKNGETSEPVKSQFGYHIIRTEDHRTKPVPTFEQVKGQIEDYLTRKTQAELIQKLRAEAKIEKIGDAAKPAEPKK
jgi:peptidyl-prolyl cis-trans isomerase C